jgi:membrane-associated phospholipid phosphatase
MVHRMDAFEAQARSAALRPDGDAAARRRRAATGCAAGLAAAALSFAHPVLKTALDLPVQAALNHPARLYPWLDYSLRILDRFPIFQGVALMALLCGALVEARRRSDVLQIVTGVFSASFAAVLSRLVQDFLPPSPRPLYDPVLHFLPPLGADVGALRDWTSYPSDHAALLAGLACTLFLVRPRLALYAFAWVAALGLVRIYGGYHYLTDTIGGWLFGAGTVFAVAAAPLDRLEPVLAFAWRYRFLAAALLFVAAVEAADMFDDVRGMAKFVLNALRGMQGLWI